MILEVDGNEEDRALVLRARELEVGMRLSRAGYGILREDGSVRDEAVREWQKAHGREATGELTIADIVAMDDLDDAFPPEEIYLPLSGEGPDVFAADGWIRAQGTWILEGETIAFPLNRHIYDCDIASGSCTHAETVLATIGQANHLRLSLETLRITSWNPPVLTLEPTGPQGCRRPVMTINTEAKEVFEVTTQAGDCEGGFERLERPRVARLVGSQEVGYEVMEENRRSTFEHMPTAVRSLLERAGQVVE
ncbi:peptidoglycan-binding domain-containing protein [Parvularcula dongshanensis]|uniref:Uncharacterized protein n=1 Tax=Parvularcula dongshanensis TaxID=1173995 RepID=A0A840I5H6_9PROT|nr:peptidoglycan-binding domain-containing protein [Parvularcula dongshanensis]MBB4660206.1 hypothetical protein [Parvularcula dongshanensis]